MVNGQVATRWEYLIGDLLDDGQPNQSFKG
jgi:hypothetical protein